MNKVKEKKVVRHKGLKILGITAATLIGLVIVLILTLIIGIFIATRPVPDTSEKALPVGGMLTSDTIEYRDGSGEDLRNNFLIRTMMLVWKYCAASDIQTHAAQTPPEAVNMYNDIPYIDDGNRYHQLDVYVPQQVDGIPVTSETKLPVIIDIHGGGWIYGAKELNRNYCLAMADRGYVVFNINYRLVPDVTVNEQLQDCAQALQWISAHMRDYPCNDQSVMLTGDSAGGQLALYSAVLAQSPELRDIFETVDPQLNIQCLVLSSPAPYMNTEGAFGTYTKLLWGKDYAEKATSDYMNFDQIIGFVDKMPPSYFITSTGDTPLIHDMTVQAHELLIQKGIRSQLADYDDASLLHVFCVGDPFMEKSVAAIDESLEFFDSVISQ